MSILAGGVGLAMMPIMSSGRVRSLGQAIGVVALLCATVGVSTASAQVDYEIMASLQFNFSNPGARSLAMAGALTGAGDDATGAWTNPGGLTNITRPEVGVEFRGFNFETPFVQGGRFSGTPSNQGADTIAGVVTGISENSTHSLSFVSAVVPKSRFAFAFYRTEVANFETNVSTDGVFYNDPNDGNSRVSRSTARSTVKIANFGGSAAVRLTDQISVGVGVSFYDFELDSTNRRFGAFFGGVAPGTFLGPPLRTEPTSSPPSSSTARTPPSASTSAPRSTRTTSSASAPATARARSSTSTTTARTATAILDRQRFDDSRASSRCPTWSRSAC